MHQGEPALLVEWAGALGHDFRSDYHMTEQAALSGDPKLGAVREFARPAEIVDDCRAQEQI